jgi:tRNA dimethylallyltransferase
MVGQPVAPGGCDAVIILGATATGKTSLGVRLARAFGGEIISADSRQVYRGLDLGSGKDLTEYGDTPYHLIDIATLEGEYSVFDYQRDFFAAHADISSRGKMPFVVGGTGMYLDAIVRGYELVEVPENPALRAVLEPLSLEELAARLLSLKKEVHNRTDLTERPRLVRAIEIAEYKRNEKVGIEESNTIAAKNGETAVGFAGAAAIHPLILGVRFDRAVLRSRIRTRLEERIRAGLVDEVRALHESGASWERLERLGLEYRYTAEYLEGKIVSEKEYTESLYTAICQFAKRQETWFRGMERKGVAIEWIENGDYEAAERAVTRSLRRAPRP